MKLGLHVAFYMFLLPPGPPAPIRIGPLRDSAQKPYMRGELSQCSATYSLAVLFRVVMESWAWEPNSTDLNSLLEGPASFLSLSLIIIPKASL